MAKRKQRINQGRLAELVAERSGVDRRTVDTVLRATFDAIGSAVAYGEEVSVTNFGTWGSRERPAGVRRNPATGGSVHVPAHRVPTFSYSDAVREAAATGNVPDTFRKLGNGHGRQG